MATMNIFELCLQEFLSVSSKEQRGKYDVVAERQRHNSLHVFIAQILKNTSRQWKFYFHSPNYADISTKAGGYLLVKALRGFCDSKNVELSATCLERTAFCSNLRK